MAKSLKRYHWNLRGIYGAKPEEYKTTLFETSLFPLVVERRDSYVSHKVSWSLHPALPHMSYHHAQFIHHTTLLREKTLSRPTISPTTSPPPPLTLPSLRCGHYQPEKWSVCGGASSLPWLQPLSAVVAKTLSLPLPPPADIFCGSEIPSALFYCNSVGRCKWLSSSWYSVVKLLN